MALIKDKDKENLKKAFEEHLATEVKLLYFTQEHECEFCKTTRELLEELEALSDRIELQVCDFVQDAEKAEEYHVDKIPALVLLSGSGQDTGIRFFGIPAGYEFTTLVEDVIDVSRGDPKLPAEVEEIIKGISEPVHLQVMVSPTCPYCPKAVRTAHRFALLNGNIRADMVETSEFPYLVQKYDVQGVPKTVINEDHSVVGAVPEMEMAQEVIEALKGGEGEKKPD